MKMPDSLSGWRSPTILLFLYGFLKETRPSEPYITVFFTTFKNFTADEVMGIIYPTGTYATMALTVVIFLITDAVLYRPIIVLQAISNVLLAVILIAGKSVLAMVIAELMYGLLISCDVAYLTYLYAAVSPDQYARVSALCRIAHLLGRAFSGLLGQMMISSRALNYLQLQYLSVSFASASLIVAIWMPPPTFSLYFHPKQDGLEQTQGRQENKCVQVMKHIRNDLRAAYTQPYVLAWTFWWVVATCLYLQALSYIQVLWLGQTSLPEDQQYNGYVEASYTVLGSGAAWLSARIVWRKQWKLWLSWCIVCILLGLLIGASVYIHQIAVLFLLYIAYGALYHAAITVASSEVAQQISNDSSALIFGVNTFVSLVLQSILTSVVTAKGGLNLSIQTQFKVYAVIYEVTAIIFLILAVMTHIKRLTIKRSGQEESADNTT